MAQARPHSLKWRLVSRLVLLQAVMLTLFVVLVLCALWYTGFLGSIDPEDTTINAVRDSIARGTNGALVLRETPALARERATSPSFWFVARDAQGQTLSEGDVPPEYARIGDALSAVGQARFGWNLGDPPRSNARFKRVTTTAGVVQILAGPGSVVPFGFYLSALGTVLATIIIPLILVMALATLMVTPFVVRRAHRGLGHVATQAEKINIDERGTRLPLDDVPQEVTPLVTAVNNALGRLDDGYERHKRFLLDAAHELRTPIAILQTRLESLPASPANGRLLEDVARLGILAEQLLDLQRLTQNTTQFAAVDLVAVGRRVAADLAPLAIAAGYAMSFEPETARVAVRGDQAALERAMINLVQNAIQHGGRKGTITIRVKAGAAILVEDEGAGVPPDQRSAIFEPFRRLHARDRGVGLGLNLVQEIVQLHQGQVMVTEAPGGGACFTMKFAAASIMP
ncbi:sensor histidine kinase [Phyllobacterium myrsinacearum]|uniref:histidine kinase n=2 Tax=Phyllobacterium myrsinacearum TaxID=28101 RepID=A0A2S9JB62_9HYPH|nr:HAMP domain-containing sensor histidine kinase [Phyllobacterium myrsinacearum]PRD50059.1 sensor histidine kinase [Phyllobacterium myrsinacearum]PWV90902.1 signal transduction histidine kinase [Phyllobacterium myrsinacearum]RZS88296.1 signal transduction histidine kinase [Phyllobacterium myrsinacearum]RZU97303.1 signal transduction histidine kinase [Phyllobacterium myrsinacearum]